MMASISPDRSTPGDDGLRASSRQRPDARQAPRLDWWRDARFGLFFHWGLYSLAAGQWRGASVPGIGEWIMHHGRIPVADYAALAARFEAAEFDAAAWVALARRAGARYVVFTAKHHDGFCMYDSALTDYTIVRATPFGRDPLAELARECARQEVRLCVYYSQTRDWHHPDGDGNDWDYDPAGQDFAAYVEHYVKPQLRELLTNYGPLGLVWFDSPERITPAQSRDLLDLVHSLQPDCLVSGRVGNDLGDYASARDHRVPPPTLDMDWETPATLNDTWGYRSDDHNWRSGPELIRELARVVTGGGNYLLNVGPTGSGAIPAPVPERLGELGDWLAGCGAAVYGTRRGPLHGPGYGSTRRGEQVFLHVWDWPEDGALALPAGYPAPAGALLLGPEPGPVTLLDVNGRCIIAQPSQAAGTPVSVIALDESQRKR